MNTLTTRLCHPFQEEVIEYGARERLDVIRLFNTIPWISLNEEIYTRQDEVIHDFYFFETTYTDTAQAVHSLNIAPEYNDQVKDNQEALTFTLRYIRPKMRRRFLGLGAEKLDKTFLTEMEGATYQLVLSSLIAFMDDDKDFLEQQILPRTSTGSNR